MNLERWRERDVERTRALNGARLSGKERFMYETAFACMDKLEALTERIKEDTRREQIANYEEWFDAHADRLWRLNEMIGPAVLDAFGSKRSSREFEMDRTYGGSRRREKMPGVMYYGASMPMHTGGY